MSDVNIFAIGDLHLPGNSNNKSMEVFGPSWKNHFGKIKADWEKRVSDSDIVLIPGDISWAMRLEDALPDLQAIGELKGRKILLRGNHDYWWSSLQRIRQALPESMYVLQNDVVELDDYIFGGTRGWLIPCQNAVLDANDIKIYQREVNRLELSLSNFPKSSKKKIGLCHYPPLLEYERDTGFSSLFAQYETQYVVYGHLHADSIKTAFEGVHKGVEYALTSADALDFKLLKIKKI